MASVLKLIIEDDEGKTTIYPLADDDVSIGRREGNTIRLMERNVSRRHARLFRMNGNVFVEDLDSYNGVRVNGERIRGRQTVEVGDLVEIGDYHLALQKTDLSDDGSAIPSPAIQETTPGLVDDGSTHRLRMETVSRKAEGARFDPDPAQRDTLIDQPRATPVPQPEVAATEPLPPLPAAADRQPDPTVASGLRRIADVPRVICVSTEYAGQAFVLGDETVIGRIEDNDIVIEHRSVSRSHAKLIATETGHKIVDLQSANGILVNGEEYAMTELRAGDLIELGHVHFRYVPADVAFEATREEAEALSGMGIRIEDPEPYDPSTAATVTDTPMDAMGFAAAGPRLAATVPTTPELPPARRTEPLPHADPDPTHVDPAAESVDTRRPAPAALPTADVDGGWTRPHATVRARRSPPWGLLVAGGVLVAALGGWFVLGGGGAGSDANARLRALYEQGNYEGVLAYYRANRRAFADPGDAGRWVGKAEERLAEGLARKGARAYQEDAYEQAVDYLERCLQRAPDMAICHRNLAIAFTQMQQFDKAARHYQRFIELEPNHAEAPAIRQILEDYRAGATGSVPTPTSIGPGAGDSTPQRSGLR